MNYLAEHFVDVLEERSRESNREKKIKIRIEAQKARKSQVKRKKKEATEKTKEFYNSKEWKAVRYQVLNHYEHKCMSCGATPADGAKLTVDHIKPRSLYPKQALDFDNLQILCQDCNEGKGNKFTKDLRNI